MVGGLCSVFTRPRPGRDRERLTVSTTFLATHGCQCTSCAFRAEAALARPFRATLSVRFTHGSTRYYNAPSGGDEAV